MLACDLALVTEGLLATSLPWDAILKSMESQERILNILFQKDPELRGGGRAIEMV